MRVVDMSAYLFDFYGVLLRPLSAEYRQRLEETVGVRDDAARARFWRAYEDLRPPYDVGLVSDARWWQRVAVEAELGKFDVARAVTTDFAGCLDCDEEMVQLALSLVEEGHTVGVLSNLPTGLAMLVRAKHLWLEELAAVTLSCDIGVAKPEREAYAVAVDALGCAAREVLFIDDRPDFIAGARAAGLRTHLFRGRAGLEAVLRQA